MSERSSPAGLADFLTDEIDAYCEMHDEVHPSDLAGRLAAALTEAGWFDG